jgi:Ca2+-binding RTX toxin-like protein
MSITETQVLPAGNWAVDKTLTVTAAPGAYDNLAITRPSASTLRVTEYSNGLHPRSGVHTGAGCARSGDNIANCNASGVTLIKVIAGDRGDRVQNSTTVRSTLNGGTQSDVLIGGSAGDTLTGGPDPDAMYGMNGNDVILARDLVNDGVINCDGGNFPGNADKADLDLSPKDGSVSNCETKTRH